MEIVQKQGAERQQFTFYDTYLNFAYSFRDGSGDFDVAYGDLPFKTALVIKQNYWLKHTGWLWIVLGAAQAVIGLMSSQISMHDGLWIVAGCVCLEWFQMTRATYTTFDTEQGTIYVLHDNQHDAIVGELTARRNQQLRQWYGEINPDNDLETEIRKFQWLAEREVISREEAERKISQARQLHTHAQQPDGHSIN